MFPASRFASVLAVAVALGLYACGEGVVLPDEGEPAAIAVIDGNEQTAPAGSTLGKELVVKVTDSRNRPVANQSVEFSIDAGGGEVAPASASTNADGLASATWKLGPGAGQQRVRARANGGGAPDDLIVSFTATAFSGSAGILEPVSGDGQVGGVNSALPDPLVVRVVDGLSNPVAGVTVTWVVIGGGSIDPETSVSGPDGTASAQRILGPNAGPQSAEASVDGLAGSPVIFSHTADASNPTALELVSGDGQTAPAGFQLPDSLVVRLLDDNGNGVGGRAVTWTPEAGVANPINSTTNPEGYAYTRWTLGPNAGSMRMTAVFSGLEVVRFTATATADVPTTIALLSGNSQSGPIGTTLPSPLRVRVTDANGNPVENVSVTWTPGGGAQVSSTTTGTDAQGIAQVFLTLGATLGTYTTTAAVDGLAGSPVTFTSIGEPGQAARLAFLSQPATAVVGQTLAAISVEIQDAQGNRVAGATNRVTITSSVAGSLVGDNQENAVDGVATFSALAINRAGTGFNLTARASALTDATSSDFDIGQGATTTAITGRVPSASVTGQSVTISYDINVTAPAAGSLTGSVQVSDGTQSCSGGINAGTGGGNCPIAFSTVGDHDLTATYSGNTNFTGSTSGAVAHSVTPASTTVTIGSIGSSTVGQPVTIPFNVTVNSPGSGAPTGSVTITISGGSETCSNPISSGSCDLTPLAGGNRTVTATYGGDANYNGDTDTEPLAVRTPTTTAVATSAGTTVFGQEVTFTATVSPISGTGTPTGTVQFQSDGANIGGPVALSGGVATRSTTTLPVGGHVITAEYTPTGTTFGGSTGTLSPNQQVNQAGTTTAIGTIDPALSNPGQPYSVSVSVQAAAPGSGTPGGSVGISDGEGGTCSAPLSGGSGSCQLSTGAPGAKTITATYNGDGNFLAGSSATAPHQVNNLPTAVADSYLVPANFFIAPPAAQGVLANDGDLDGHTLRAVGDSDAANGTLILNLNGDGGFIYTPTPGFVGPDSFTYHATDGFGNSATVTVTLQVQ